MGKMEQWCAAEWFAGSEGDTEDIVTECRLQGEPDAEIATDLVRNMRRVQVALDIDDVLEFVRRIKAPPQVPAGLKFAVPPGHAGQLVEVSYALEGGQIYRRRFDRARRSVRYARQDAFDDDAGDFWNRSPLYPAAEWQPCRPPTDERATSVVGG